MSAISTDSPRPAHPFRARFPEFLEFGKRRMRSQGRVLAASVAVGIVAGVGGILFSIAGQAVVQLGLEGVAGYHASGPAGEVKFPWIPSPLAPFNPWLLLLVPPFGGLLSGLLVLPGLPWRPKGTAPTRRLPPTTSTTVTSGRSRGSADQADWQMRLTIRSGRSGGREGPIAQIGAGFGSLLGGILRFRPEERRVLVAAGMGAGVAAIFRAPLAGTLFAAENHVLLARIRAGGGVLPTGLASVVSYCTFGMLAFSLGGTTAPWRALFDAPSTLVFTSAWELLPYSLLAIWVAVLAMVYVRSFYAIQHAFESVRIGKAFRPALGALLSAVLALVIFFAVGRQRAALSVLSFGYGVLQEGLYDEASLSALLLLVIAVGKIVTTGLTIGSGGSGGVFGPSMVIGGCAGGSLGVFVHSPWPAAVPHPGTFAILGMAGFFAAAAKTPFSTLVIVSEMTGDYRLLLPALWVCTLAFLLSDEQPLYRSQVASRALSPAHRGELVRQVLAGLRVRQFLSDHAEVPTLRANDPLSAVVSRFDPGAYSVVPVVGPDNSLLGVIVLDELHLAVQAESCGLRGFWPPT